MKTWTPPQIDLNPLGLQDQQLRRIAGQIERGIARFWAKRGGDPEAGGWRQRRDKAKQKLLKETNK